MLKNYFKIGARYLLKNKIFSLINILGLSIGMAGGLLIIQYTSFEMSFDDFHEHNPDIYRVRLDRIYSDRHDKSAGVTAGVGPALYTEFPEVTGYTKLWGTKHLTNIIQYKEKTFNESKLYFADSSFFEIFSFPLLKGNAKTALKEPHSIVLTETAAERYFDDEDPLGKTVLYSNPWEKAPFKVTGVVADPPENSHIKFDVLVSFGTLVEYTGGQAQDSFGWNAFPTYILLEDGYDIDLLQAKLRPFIEEKYKNVLQNDVEVKLLFQPLQDIHLYSDLRFELEPNGNARSVYFLIVIALFIITIAWVNYVNLSTSKSLERAKEVGIRKVAGARRNEVIRQFLTESFLINFLALIIAITIVQLTLPAFNTFIGKDIGFNIFRDPALLVIITSFILVGSFLSGLYPALIMSSFKPVTVLKGTFGRSGKGLMLRKVLVVFQFALSGILVAGTLTVYKQLTYMQNQELGVDISQTLVINGPGTTDSTYLSKLNVFKEEISGYSKVKHVTNSTMVPGKEIGWVNNTVRRAEADSTDVHSMPHIGTGADFIPAFGLKIIAGRNFQKERADERNKLILSEKAVSVLGFDSPGDALNKGIIDSGERYEVIGITENYHQQSLSNDYLPVIFRYVPGASTYYAFKLYPGDIPETVNFIQDKYQEFFPGNPFDYFFLDEFYNRQYKSEIQFGNTFGAFSLLAIFVACLGLAGLASFHAKQRIKEIGIRKVMGATSMSILKLLSTDLIKLVLTGLVIGLPLSYFGSDQWLTNYAFRIDISWWFAIIPTILILLVTLITIIPQTLHAANSNPARSLKYE